MGSHRKWMVSGPSNHVPLVYEHSGEESDYMGAQTYRSRSSPNTRLFYTGMIGSVRSLGSTTSKAMMLNASMA